MGKAALVSFIVDLKLTPDGDVRILELGDLFLSGFAGYKNVTGKHAVTDVVFPFYESFGLPMYQSGGSHYESYTYKSSMDSKAGLFPFAPRADFDAGSLAQHSLLLIDPQHSKERVRQEMREAPFDQVLRTNVNTLANACFVDKSIMTAFGQQYAPDLFPAQKLYAVNKRGQVDGKQIAQDFAGHDLIVLKNPYQANAAGVDIVNLRSLSGAFNCGAGNLYLKLFTKPALGRSTTCVVQEYIKGKKVEAVNKRGETGSYDPTMRVIVTAWHDNGQTHIKCHDAYYKLPKKPAAEKIKRGNTISKVSNDIGPGSAAVPEEDKAVTFEKLEAGLPAMFDALFTVPSHEAALSFLQSDDEALQTIGIDLATSREYFDRASDSEDYPQALAQALYERRAEHKIIENIRVGEKWGPEGLQESLANFAGGNGPKQKRSYRPFIYAGAAVAALAGLATCMNYASDPDRKVERVFNPGSQDDAQIAGLENLQMESLIAYDPEKYIEMSRTIAEQAREEGYELCLSGQWPDDANRLFQAFRIAMQLPDEQFVKIDLATTIVHENNGVKVSEELVTDTFVYGTSCPAKTTPN